MMILKQKKVKLENEDTTTRRNPDSTSEIYLIAVKAAQCRQLDENRREKGEVKKEIAIETLTINVHLQLKQSKAFDRCINSMNSMSSSNTDEERLIQLIQKSSNTIKDAFVQI